jgi:hypothetical protein
MAKKSGNWIQKARIKKGGLHKTLGVPEGKTIPAKKINAAIKKSKSPSATASQKRVGKMANLAKTSRRFVNSGGGRLV